MPETRRKPEPALTVWLKSSHLIGAACMLAALVLVLGLAFVQFEISEKASDSTLHHEQLAKLMAHQTTADINAVESLMLVLASANRDLIDPKAPGRLEALVSSVVRSHPQLRSLSVLNEDARVLGSTSQSNLDVKVDLSIFGDVPMTASRVFAGPMLAGRDLADLQRRAPVASRLNVLPMLMRISTPGGQGLLLVALINADYFSSFFEASANDPTVRISLTGYQGELLVASSNVRRALGSDLSQLPLFSDYLPKKEWGSYVGPGLDDERVVTGFATLVRWPMVLIAESSFRDVMAGISHLEKWIWLTMLVTLILIAVLTTATTLSLNRHATITRKLHGEVYASEARNKAVLESAIDSVIISDSAGIIVAFNRAAEQVFGYKREDCIGKSIEKMLVPSQMRSSHTAAMKRYLENGDGPVLNRLDRRIETYAQRSDGTVFPVEMSNVEINVDGDTFFTTTVKDITKAKAAAVELDVTLRHYRELADALELQKQGFDHHAIVSISDANETIVYANDKLLDILGYSKEELIGRKYYEFRQRLPQEVYEGLRHSLAEGHVWHGELAMRRRDGSNYWVSNTSVPILDEKGAVKQYITVQTDISDLRQTQIDLAEARRRELEIGTRIQKSLLAANAMDDMVGLWLTSFNQASKGVDGDFVDVIRMGEYCVDVLAGDVMGKGVPAALMGAATKLQFSRSIAELLAATGRDSEPPAPKAIVAAVHKAMTPHLQDLEAFVTLVYLRIDILNQVVTWVGCGHEETLIVRNGGEVQSLSNQHPPMGVLDNIQLQQDQVALKEGDAVFLCSDGLTDAVQKDGERVGRDVLNLTVRQMVREHQTPAAALHSLRRQVLRDDVKLIDDVTMVMIMRVAADGNKTRCELPIDFASVRALREFVSTQTQRAGLSEQDVALFIVASVEIFTNVVRHATGLLAEAPIEVVARCRAHEFVLDMVHLGDAFAPPQEEIVTDFDTFPEGGFGLTIIRNACDRVEYSHHAGVNTVRMTRYIGAK